MTQRADTDAGRRSLRGLWGGLIFVTLVAAYWWTPGPVCGAVGGGTTTNATFTISTSHHTTYSTAEGCTPHTKETVATTATFGPAWIGIGDDGGDTIHLNCSPGFPFEVVAGTVNYNTNMHTETFVCSADPAAVPTLSEWAQIGMAALLVGGGLLAIRKRAAV